MLAGLHYYHSGRGSLLSFGLDYSDRLKIVLEFKDPLEHVLRIHHMQQVTQEMLAELPEGVLRAGVEWAWAKDWCKSAESDFNAAWQEYVLFADNASACWLERASAYRESCGKELLRASVELDRACAECASELCAWHDRWCHARNSARGCAWDGKRIVGL